MVTNFAENLYHRRFNQAGVCVSRHVQKELLKAKKNIKVKFDCQLHSELFHKIDKLNNLAKFSFYFVLHRKHIKAFYKPIKVKYDKHIANSFANIQLVNHGYCIMEKFAFYSNKEPRGELTF